MGVNHEGASPKIKRVMQIIYEEGPCNIGCVPKGQNLVIGYNLDELLPQVKDNWPVFSVFSDPEKVLRVLRRLKEEDLGLSVVVSGLTQDVYELAAKEDLAPHSVHFSLGIHGNLNRVADEKDLEVTTMCGHGLVAARLVQYLREEVAAGRRTPREAALEAAKPCSCGIFNVDRAEKLFAVGATADCCGKHQNDCSGNR
jgi:hypothetical protein